MFMGVNRVIHFPRREVKTIHVGHCKVGVGLKRKCSSQADTDKFDFWRALMNT